MKVTIPTPLDFNFRRTVMSHGWCALLPFEFDKTTWTLIRVLDAGEATPVTVRITSAKRALAIELSRRLKKASVENVIRDVRHMFRLDDDLQVFYKSVSAEAEFAWIADEGAGRLLRSPTVFEDLVKMICTTNCSWALTEKMVAGLVNKLGKVSDDGRKSFPSAAAMARRPVGFFRDKIRSGYRAPYLKELAQRVARGSLEVESWLTSDLPVAELLKEMKSVKGVGNYAAENLLKLLGRYDGLALDSWTRAQFARVRNQDRAANDKKISRFYARFGSWRGLVLWCDMTRHWLDPENIGNW
ncbi:MAG: Fe-S cluster assembly protein HesB [Acidobacteria bacterium]|nr:MAG: Fe-S cluster assembly protein HesB [Acidobacteriota bacterium]